MPGIEHYAAPRSLSEAVDLLKGGDVTVLAGGTDVMPQSHAGRLTIKSTLMNIRRIPELRHITETGRVLQIGATTTITELRDDARIKARLGVLWQACDHFASDQIRNAGTIGGNICNASPAGDTLVPLLVLNARVVLASKPNGSIVQRQLPLREFLVGHGKTCRTPAELLTAIEIDLPTEHFESHFYKFGTRPALDISTISIGLGFVRTGGVLRDVRVAFGAVAATPIRTSHAESVLEGKTLDDATIDAACAAAERDIHPISDVRATDWYRRELIRNMFGRMLNNVRHG